MSDAAPMRSMKPDGIAVHTQGHDAPGPSAGGTTTLGCPDARQWCGEGGVMVPNGR
jgi:hypothetical protein